MIDLKASIILPVLNEEETIEKCIISILSQTETRWELIVINDGSTDDTVNIVEKFIKKDKRIKIINNKNHLGIIGCLNQGWRNANSDLICRADADDICLPDRLKIQIDFMQKNKEIDVLGCGAKVIIKSKKENKFIINLPETHKEIYQNIYKNNPLIHSSIMMKKSFLEKLNGYKFIGVKNLEDYYLWSRGMQNFKFHNLQIPLIQLSRREAPTWKEIYNRTIGHFLILLENNSLLRNFIWPLVNLSVMVLSKLKIYNPYRK